MARSIILGLAGLLLQRRKKVEQVSGSHGSFGIRPLRNCGADSLISLTGRTKSDGQRS